MFSVIHLVILAVLVLAGVVAYKRWKSGKAVTGSAVVSGVETDVKTAVSTVETDVKNDVSKL